MELPLLTSNIIFYISTLLCLVTIATIVSFVLPLQIKQLGVKNGLKLLRTQLLGLGITLLITTSVAFYFLLTISLRVYESGTVISTPSQLLILTFAIGKVAIAYFCFKIYHQQYTPEHIKVSNKINTYMNSKKRG